jgi:hypothetical protein
MEQEWAMNYYMADYQILQGLSARSQRYWVMAATRYQVERMHATTLQFVVYLSLLT